MDLLITGATGFVGSHLALRWLRHYKTARIGCLVREADTASGLLRLHAALRRAAAENDVAPDEDLDALLSRVDAVPGTLNDTAWIDRAESWMRGPTELIHCAANLSFREADRPTVWASNVDGTAALLRALPRLRGIVAMNYVSTAYVAGDRQGTILEDEQIRPAHFNNPYEESKWAAECLVREICTESDTPWRIMRPSIVIGHSKTHRLSSQSGFYQVVDTLLRLGRQSGLPAGPIPLPVERGTALDLIPVDIVAAEIIALIGHGDRTENRVFHIVGEAPLLLADVLRELTPMSGVRIEVSGTDTALPSPLAKLVMHRLRYYMPYFAFARRFDRRGTQAAIGSESYRITIEQLRLFVQSYMAQQMEARG